MIARRPIGWHRARVVAARMETARVRRLDLEIATWPGNEAGQHLDVRLTAADGYQASRSYSIASSGDATRVTLLIEEMADGEVSPYLVERIAVGDEIEVHGPLGLFFVWRAPTDAGAQLAPVQLIGGGSGVVPLVAMAAAHARAGDPAEFRLLYSVRSPPELLFESELASLAGVTIAYTREAPPGSPRPAGRLTRDELAALAIPPERGPRVYVCGSNRFVEAITGWLLDLGHPAVSIRTERFGGA